MAHPASNRLSHTLLLALAGALALTGCGNATPAPESAPVEALKAAKQTEAAVVEESPAKATPAQPMPTTPFDLSAFDKLTDEQLHSGYRLAIEERRIMDPGYNNVVAYQLAMRHRFGESIYQGLLNDVAPEVMLRAERAIEQGNEADRVRFIQMLEAINPALPSIPRLKAMPAGSSVWGPNEGTAQDSQALPPATGEPAPADAMDDPVSSQP